MGFAGAAASSGQPPEPWLPLGSSDFFQALGTAAGPSDITPPPALLTLSSSLSPSCATLLFACAQDQFELSAVHSHLAV